MTEENTSESSQINDSEKQTKQKGSQTKDKKNQTDNIKWSIFTEAETKVAAGKAAKKAGLKLNEWIDQTLREAAITTLTQKPEPPAKLEDTVNDIVAKFADRLKAEQADTIKAQNNLIQEQGKQLEQLTKAIQSQPSNLKELLFGKNKKPS